MLRLLRHPKRVCARSHRCQILRLFCSHTGSVFWFTAVLPKAKDKQARRAIRPDKPPMFKPLHKDPLQVIVYNEVDLAR